MYWTAYTQTAFLFFYKQRRLATKAILLSNMSHYDFYPLSLCLYPILSFPLTLSFLCPFSFPFVLLLYVFFFIFLFPVLFSIHFNTSPLHFPILSSSLIFPLSLYLPSTFSRSPYQLIYSISFSSLSHILFFASLSHLFCSPSPCLPATPV